MFDDEYEYSNYFVISSYPSTIFTILIFIVIVLVYGLIGKIWGF